MRIESIKGTDKVILCRPGGKSFTKTILAGANKQKSLREAIGEFEKSQNAPISDLLIKDKGPSLRNQIKKAITGKNILFYRDIKLAIKNINILYNPKTRLSKNDFRVIDVIPKDPKGAENVGVSWNVEGLKCANGINSIFKVNLGKNQIFTPKPNKKPYFFERFTGTIFRDKNKKESKEVLLNKFVGDPKKIRVLIIVGHGANCKLHLPTGEKISFADIHNLPSNKLKNTYVHYVTCGGGLELNKSSIVYELVKKGALGVISSEKKFGVYETHKSYFDTFKKFKNKNTVQIREVNSDLMNVDGTSFIIGVETKKLGLTPFYLPSDIRELSILTVVYC